MMIYRHVSNKVWGWKKMRLRAKPRTGRHVFLGSDGMIWDCHNNSPIFHWFTNWCQSHHVSFYRRSPQRKNLYTMLSSKQEFIPPFRHIDLWKDGNVVGTFIVNEQSFEELWILISFANEYIRTGHE